MDAAEFRVKAKEVVDFIADYMETIENRRVSPDVNPGYLINSVPKDAPEGPESFEDIMKDFKNIILPGILHHQHPLFNAYFPLGHSFASILGTMLSDGIGGISTSWAISPACTELEMVVTDWLGKLVSLPKQFLHEGGEGGGSIQGSGSECIFLALSAAKRHAQQNTAERAPRLVAYISCLANICVQKACSLGSVILRQIEVDENLSLSVEALKKSIMIDKSNGLDPFFVCATVGTTSCCSFDDVYELSEMCEKENLWLHVDAAYAGCALICPEFHYLINGKENISSISFNPHKWLLTTTECAVLWVKNKKSLNDCLAANATYLQHKHQAETTDFRNWGIGITRPFRALKLWFVLRLYGISGLQEFIRRHIKLAKRMKDHIESNHVFEIVGKSNLGLVAFCIKGPSKLTTTLLRNINESGNLHLTEASVNGRSVIRYVVCAEKAKEKDVDFAWSVISSAADGIFSARG
ncbi:tyrosine decarboxylase-like [Saccostrea echinata]|uniref:tyrosine decarboxylase-like n=1 Tax=Saccostrea echinata TaxID=191078 RepID=UPI002A832553|nr:tyrosine decarboxylase-like [Saccostrea echinata]